MRTLLISALYVMILALANACAVAMPLREVRIVDKTEIKIDNSSLSSLRGAIYTRCGMSPDVVDIHIHRSNSEIELGTATNVEGYFKYDNLPPGLYTLSIREGEYAFKAMQLEIPDCTFVFVAIRVDCDPALEDYFYPRMLDLQSTESGISYKLDERGIPKIRHF